MPGTLIVSPGLASPRDHGFQAGRVTKLGADRVTGSFGPSSSLSSRFSPLGVLVALCGDQLPVHGDLRAKSADDANFSATFCQYVLNSGFAWGRSLEGRPFNCCPPAPDLLVVMTMLITIYAVVSVTFSLGFFAGAWWASRRRDEVDLVHHEHAALKAINWSPRS